MTTLQKQIKHINNNLFAARMENIIQYMYEDELEKQVAKVFHRMRKGILKNLKEYYSPDIMVNAHMDLILAPIHEYHKKYYDTIMKYKLREHRKGQVQGRRLVKRAKQYAKAYSKNYFGAVKADSTIPMSSIIQKDKLFATSDYSAEHMRDKTFLASENTLARVDKDINKIITDGYTDGWGINDVASNIEKRFNQLETWEARRIARTEIHGSHMQGIMQSYEEMGVEYTQWASAHDNRTRDTHSALDGEIIPFGGVYSNGLRYPGDTNGPISEWINCRCGNIPWFCPPGMMVPVGMSHFRESDLIPLGYYDKPGVIESLQPDNVDKVLNEINTSSSKWDINRLTPGEKKAYLRAKKNYLILDDAIKNKNYSRLNDLEDDPMMFIRNKETFMTNTDNLTDFSLVKEEMEEYLDDIIDYEKIIKDKNIEVDITPRKIEWKNKDLNNGLWVNLDKKTGEYTLFNPDEKFIAYKFKKEGLTIKESVDTEVSQVRALYKEYKKLPELLQNTDEIVLSNQYLVDKASAGKSILNIHKSYYQGYVLEGEGTRIVSFQKPFSDTLGTVVHEATHNLEKELLYYISNSDEYVLAFKKDQKRLIDMGHELKDIYVTKYAQGFTETAINGGENAYRAYSEDLAESMKEYFKNKKTFTEKYPEKTKVLEKILKGEFKPETTTSYKEFYKIESRRFRPMPDEMERAQEIRWKQADLAKEGKSLSQAERDELKLFDDKQMLNYLHNQKIRGETLPDNEEKVYRELYKKFTNKAINELTNKNINDSFTKYITKDNKYTINVRELDNPQEFIDSLKKAVNTVDDRFAWRVEVSDDIANYYDCRMFITENGSTLAIREDGDIISVCAFKENGESLDSSRALLEFATRNGGDRLDSFDGNYGFYRRCGFEPVTHIEFNEEYAPPGWIKGKDDPENVIFFKYTGEEVKNAQSVEFYRKVEPIVGDDAYDDAYILRDKSIEKDLGLKK